MIAIPFIYFSLLLIYILRAKRRIDLSALITGAYVVTSFFAIFIEMYGLYGEAGCVKSEINVVPTLLYISLGTITIIPFKQLPQLTINNLVPIVNGRLFNYIIYFYWLVFFLVLFFFLQEIIVRVTSPDIGILRILYNEGEDDLGFEKYSGYKRIIARLSFIFGSSAMLLQVLYFYSLAYLNKSFKFNLGILILSTMPIIIGMLSFDRSKLIYWFMSFVALAIFFWPSFSIKRQKQVKFNFIFLSSLFSFYMAIITISRFGEANLGTGNSLIVYAGQSFNNFCLFYEKLQINSYSFEKITPLLHYFFTSENSSEIYRNFPIDTNVFASFMGMIMRDIGVIGMVIYCIIFYLITHSLFNKIRTYNIQSIYLVIILLYVPYLGIFGIYYGTIDRVLSVWVVLIIAYFLRKRFVKHQNFN